MQKNSKNLLTICRSVAIICNVMNAESVTTADEFFCHCYTNYDVEDNYYDLFRKSIRTAQRKKL